MPFDVDPVRSSSRAVGALHCFWPDLSSARRRAWDPRGSAQWLKAPAVPGAAPLVRGVRRSSRSTAHQVVHQQSGALASCGAVATSPRRDGGDRRRLGRARARPRPAAARQGERGTVASREDTGRCRRFAGRVPKQHVGFVFQFHHLLPSHRLENVMAAGSAPDAAEARPRAGRCWGARAGRAGRPPDRLSPAASSSAWPWPGAGEGPAPVADEPTAT